MVKKKHLWKSLTVAGIVGGISVPILLFIVEYLFFASTASFRLLPDILIGIFVGLLVQLIERFSGVS